MTQDQEAPQDLVYADVAGLQDTSGGLIEFINMFVIKGIFSKAKRIRFIVPMTFIQIHDNRGQGAREQLKTIQRICSSSLHNVVDAMQPVITKCKPNQEYDIEVLRTTLDEQLQSEIQCQKVNVDGNTSDQDEDEFQEHYSTLSTAFSDFASKLEIYDPLAREIKNEDGEDQALSREEMVEEINALEPIVGGALNVPLGEVMLEELHKLMASQEMQCANLFQEYLDRGWNIEEK